MAYCLKGKKYLSVSGLLNAISRDCGAVNIGMVASDNTITARAADRKTTLAVYYVSPPIFGEHQFVTKCLPVDASRVDAMIASMQNINTRKLVLAGKLPASTRATMPAHARLFSADERKLLLMQYRAHCALPEVCGQPMVLHTPYEVDQAITLENAR